MVISALKITFMISKELDLDPVHTIPAEFENGMKFLRLRVAFTRCRYEIVWNRIANRKSLKTVYVP